MPDLDAYCRRIHYSGPREATLSTLHAILQGHASSIPFENLDVLLGRPIQLEPEALEQKLVHDRRGGYCFEQNGFLLLVLQQLGFAVTPLSARVRQGRERSFTPPRTHLFLKVDIDGVGYVADVGVGSASLSGAIQIDCDDVQPTPHEPRRLLREDGRRFHQIKLGDDWTDVYEFTGEEMPFIDRQVANWWTSTNPGSKFRQNLMCARTGPEGTRFSILNDEFTHRRGAVILAQRRIGTAEDLLEILDTHFGMHFPPGTRFEWLGFSWPA